MDIENRLSKIENIIIQLNELKKQESFETEADIIDNIISNMIMLWDWNKNNLIK